MHTVTITDTNRTNNLPTVWHFDYSANAYENARATKAKYPNLEVTVTDPDGSTVEIQQNGWSRVNA